jgi:hypothetical protein
VSAWAWPCPSLLDCPKDLPGVRLGLVDRDRIPDNVIAIARIADGGTVAMASDLYRHASVGIIVDVLGPFPASSASCSFRRPS